MVGRLFRLKLFVYPSSNQYLFHPQLNMLLSQLFTLLLYMLIINQVIISAATNIHENVAISCGASGNSPAPDGRVWVGDASFTSSLLQLTGKSIKSKVPHQAALSDPVPYKSARTSGHEFTYQLSVKPGQKFIRLHFKPASYKGFKKSKAIFTVKTGQHTLLSDFIPTLAAGMNYFKKEFFINVQESEKLSITFVPSRKPSFSEDTYAFVNAIEIVSMPAGLYFTPDGDQGVPVVGRKYRFYIDNSTALETIQRINVGGNSISSLEDATMFRDWEDDTNYLIEVGAFSINRAVAIRYTSSATHIAPKEVYQTARSVGAHCHSNICNLTWNIPLDLGFRYLVRLHFCEVEPAMTSEGERNFTIVINNQNAEDEADVIKWSGGHGISVYRDYVAIMEGDRREGKHNLSIVLQPKFDTISKHSNAILNGLEVFKISNPDNNLGSVSPVHPVTSSIPEKSKQSLSFSTKNKIATVLTFIVTLINVAVYYIRCNSEINSGKTNNRISSGEHQCGQFSLDEMVRSTNNFDPQLVIGSGGYGTVYKGDIDAGETTVAVKRLKSGSSQGENEFWTEIEMLSTHRHENLLSLIGYCNEGVEMLLVYDYMPRGSLADHLFKMDRSSSSFSWEQRLKIAIGAACGLNFLHTSQNRVIHRDVKSSNILLDENWVSKISDFGLSKMGPGNESATHVSTQVKGTFGYLDPEYFLTNRLTWKTDVYAFGVVLFEVLSGRPAVDMRLPEEQHGLVAWAKQCIKEGEISNLIDKNLAGSISSTCLKVFIGISSKCFNGRPHERPAMSEVVKSLELALVFQKNADEGVISFDDTSTSQSKVEAERASIKEDCNGVDRAERIAISRKKVKSEDKSIFIASPRWWDIRGFFRKAPPKQWNPNSQISPHPNLRIFSFAELKAATRKFNNDTMLGEGGYGNVYKGWLDESASSKSGRTAIAVKKLDSESLQGFEEWQSEVSFLGRFSHPNLVKLLGYCQEDKELLLVYEFMQKGSLDNHLFGKRSAALSLPWNVRVKIVIGAARGLAFLHASEKQVIYRNFKASNILLDGSYNAKISDFGLAKLGTSASQSHVSTRVMGTYGYAAPEYVATGHLYVKSDVYAFGVFLVEMLTGLRAVDSNRPNNQHNLVQWIKPHLSDKRKLKDKMDSRLGGKYPSRAAVQIAQLALSCLGNEPKSRPSMKEVVEKLEQIEASNERPKEPRISSKHQNAERYGQESFAT